jgi:hypothetical protein
LFCHFPFKNFRTAFLSSFYTRQNCGLKQIWSLAIMLVDYRLIVLRFFAQFWNFKLFSPPSWINFCLEQIFEGLNFWLGQNFCSDQNDRPGHNLSQGDNFRPGQKNKRGPWRAGLGRPDQKMLFPNPVRSPSSGHNALFFQNGWYHVKNPDKIIFIRTGLGELITPD